MNRRVQCELCGLRYHLQDRWCPECGSYADEATDLVLLFDPVTLDDEDADVKGYDC